MARRPLLLIGAGGFARETLELIAAVNAAAPAWDVIGLLDDNPAVQGTEVHGVPVLGPAELAHDRTDAQVVACVASPTDPLRRCRLVARLGLPAERFATLVHPAAVVPASAEIGPGCVLHATTVLTADIRLGAHVAMMPAVVLTHDVTVEEGVTFAARVSVAGGVAIGRGAYIGAGALLREELIVGEGSLVGMGAVVTRDVPAHEVWMGVPARRLRSADAAGILA